MKKAYKHTAAHIFNYSFWVATTAPESLKTTFESALHESGFTIILFNEHHFPEQGYTCFWLLAESHLAIHTFPESNKSYIELSSCNEEKLNQFKTLVASNSVIDKVL